MDDYKILVTGPSWIGDMVMAQSLFKLLHKNIPGLVLDVLAPGWTLPLLERMPEVRNGIDFPSRHGKLDLRMRVKTGLMLKKEAYNEAVIIPRSLKSVLPSYFAGIKHRTGLKSHFGLINKPRKYRKSRDELFVRRFLALGCDNAYTLDFDNIPKPSLSIDINNRNRLLEQHGLENRKFIVIAPGAEFGPSKQWPAKNYAQLVDLVQSENLQVCILGSARDKTVSQEIIAAAEYRDIVNLCGLTSLTDVVDIMSAAICVVSNDSGLMHIAAASDTRLVAIYGSTSDVYTPPLSAKDAATTIGLELECRPCFDRECKFGHTNCLTRISASRVFEAVFSR